MKNDLKAKINVSLPAAMLVLLLSCSQAGQAEATEMTMYKDPGCTCCTSWAEHLRSAGFTVKEKKVDNMDAVKSYYNVPEKLASCHTGIINGYVIEGHVPAGDIQRLLDEKPAVAGLTAPGMPQKSPGMQPAGMSPKDYDVLSFDKDGSNKVFSRY